MLAVPGVRLRPWHGAQLSMLGVSGAALGVLLTGDGRHWVVEQGATTDAASQLAARRAIFQARYRYYEDIMRML